MALENFPNDSKGDASPHGNGRGQDADPSRSPSNLSFNSGLEQMLPQVKRRFSELAEMAIKESQIPAQSAPAVLNSLALSFDRTIRGSSLVLQRQLAGDVEAALSWGTGKLIETCHRIIADGKTFNSSLQPLAVLQLQVLEAMMPHLSPQQPGTDSLRGTFHEALFKSFCELLNDGLEASQQAEGCYSENSGGRYLAYRIRSQVALREAARTLRKMAGSSGFASNDLKIGLYGFQLELAAHSGSLRSFLRALSNLATAAKLPRYREQAVQPHCLMGDLLPTLFHKHFEFTIDSPGDAPVTKQEELINAAHASMWRKAEPAISRLLQEPEKLTPTTFKNAVLTELLRVIKEVNPQLASKRVMINITRTDFREISRGKSYQRRF
ncbi:MAG: hypothetical protein GX589_05410 [Deltaproteobacteria bacterium]|nr:hypothetical protein [Deltaproteobacteria bacterium]